MHLHVEQAKYIEGHRVHLRFNDGVEGEVDLGGLLNGPIFESLKDEAYFRCFRLEGHTLSWDNGADFAPEYLHGLVHSESAA